MKKTLLIALSSLCVSQTFGFAFFGRIAHIVNKSLSMSGPNLDQSFSGLIKQHLKQQWDRANNQREQQQLKNSLIDTLLLRWNKINTFVGKKAGTLNALDRIKLIGS